MAHFQSHQQQPHQVATDEYGNPIQNPPVHHSMATPAATTHGLHRSGSSSSSSSEEDEHGVRRKKKGMKEKIKEKIPGVGGDHHRDQQSSQYGTPMTTNPGGNYEQHHEKRGIMDKIKDKIPGTGSHHQG